MLIVGLNAYHGDVAAAVHKFIYLSRHIMHVASRKTLGVALWQRLERCSSAGFLAA
jgi:hypothetical protein